MNTPFIHFMPYRKHKMHGYNIVSNKTVTTENMIWHWVEKVSYKDKKWVIVDCTDLKVKQQTTKRNRKQVKWVLTRHGSVSQLQVTGARHEAERERKLERRVVTQRLSLVLCIRGCASILNPKNNKKLLT